MSMLRTLPSLAAACGLALFAAASASAQQAAPAASDAGRSQEWTQHRAEMREHMQQMRAEHLKLLHDALAIRPDQEAAWQAFAASMTPQPGEHREWKDGEHRHLTAPERVDRAVERAQAHLAQVQRHAAAVKALYAVLSPTQQRTFDAIAQMHMGHGFGHGGGMHPGMGGMGGMGEHEGHEGPGGA